MRARLTSVLFVVLALSLAFFACDDGLSPQKCTNIPEGGCPLLSGASSADVARATCTDPSCAAVYECRPNDTWELAQVCPPREAGAPVDAGQEAAIEASAPPFDAAIDAPPGAYGGEGCGSLQLPDCALGVVLGCSGCCGCEDLFVCEDKGWTLWGSCGAAGVTPAR